MSNIFILALLTSYVAMLVTIAVIQKKWSISYQKLQPENLKTLNRLHIIIIIVMLLPTYVVNPFPSFLLLFPGTISMKQGTILVICFAAIWFLPWQTTKRKRINRKTGLMPAPRVILYALLRILFLIVYEWFFRGLLLVSFTQVLGAAWAITINIFLYTLSHFHKSREEIIGCIPFGLLVCALTLWCQSIWPAVILHLQIAAVHEWPLLYRFISPHKPVVQ